MTWTYRGLIALEATLRPRQRHTRHQRQNHARGDVVPKATLCLMRHLARATLGAMPYQVANRNHHAALFTTKMLPVCAE